MHSAKKITVALAASHGLLAVAGALLLSCPGTALGQGAQGSKPAEQGQAKAEPDKSANPEADGAAPRDPSPKPPPAAGGAGKREAVAEGRETFVDRDGDGIQDGQEHRFRRRGSGARSTDSNLGGERRQTRYRGGDGRGGPNGNGPRR